MAEVILPPNIPPASMEWKLIDSTAVARSAFSGAVRTVDRAGSRWGCTVSWQNLTADNRHALMAFAASLRGRSNRVRLFDASTAQRGSMPDPELVPNNTFTDGTTGWTSGSPYSLSVSNGVLRNKRLQGGTTSDAAFRSASSATVQYSPYVARAMFLEGRGSFTAIGPQLGTTAGANDIGEGSSTGYGYKLLTATAVPTTTTFYGLIDLQLTGLTAGDYFDVPFTSLARCALLDGGGNLLQQSDTLGTTWTATNVTVASNSGTAPDGTTTADGIQETATTASHSIQQAFTLTTAAQDVAFSFAVKAGTRGFAALEMSGGAGSVSSYINLSTGAISSTGATSNWANSRAFATSLGNGWWYFCLVARKTDATTACTARLYAATASGTSNYLGVAGADAILGWRGTLAVSSHPTRLTSSVAAIVSPASQSGTGLYLKGLPVSTNGLLNAGDRVEIAGQMVMATASLDSDAAGMGYLQCFPPLRTSSAADVPVIFTTPTMRAILADDNVGWNTSPGYFSDFSLSFEEAFS